MKYFITGATGFIGSELTRQLLASGHKVVGLARTQEKAEALKALGAEVVMGTLDDLELLKKTAGESDGVAHLAFPLNFADFPGSCAIEKRAIVAMCDTLAGTNKPFIGTGGLLVLPHPIGDPLPDELSMPHGLKPPFSFRAANEDVVLGYKDKGVRAMVMRLSPTVHDENDKGFITMWMGFSKKLGYVPIINGGENSWCAVHKSDAASLYAKMLEKGAAGRAYHAVAETNQVKNIGAAIAKKLGLETKVVSSEDAPPEVGAFKDILGINAPASAEKTKKELDWTPAGITVLEDIEKHYT